MTRPWIFFGSLAATATLLGCAMNDGSEPPETNNSALLSQGTGLKGEYFDNIDLTNLKVTRTDPTVSFDWGTGDPATGIDGDSFSVRWTGFVEPRYSETYTFYTRSDDGIRLWINDQLVINNWTNHAATENSGTIALTAGQTYPIKIEYYDSTWTAVASLSWSSSQQAKQVIPQSQLYVTQPAPGGTCGSLPVAAIAANGYQDPNAPANAIDNDLATRWSQLGQGSWIQADLGSTKTVCSVKLAWFVGDTRKSSFQIALSTDGTTFTTVFTGQSSGAGTGLETYDFADAQARYVRVIVNGNVSNDGLTTTDWASISELSVLGGAGTEPPPTEEPPPPPMTTGYPNAANTGYPHGLPGDTRTPVTLTPYTGPCTITVAGTVIDSKDITCRIDVKADNVVIRRSRIRVSNSAAIHTTDLVNLLVEDTELDGQMQDTSAGGISLIGDGGYTLRRVNAHSSGDIARADWSVEIYDSWLHDPGGLAASQHNDVIQTTNTTHLRIIHNRLENPHTQTSCILLKADIGPINDVVVDNNLLNGGGYSFYWYDAGYRATNGTVTNNRWLRSPDGYYPNGGYWGPAAINAASPPAWTNNAWYDNGAPL